MARVVPVGPIDPELYAFAKKEAEKAERNPRYVPKNCPADRGQIIYKRIGNAVKALVMFPELIGMHRTNFTNTYVPYKKSLFDGRYDDLPRYGNGIIIDDQSHPNLWRAKYFYDLGQSVSVIVFVHRQVVDVYPGAIIIMAEASATVRFHDKYLDEAESCKTIVEPESDDPPPHYNTKKAICLRDKLKINVVHEVTIDSDMDLEKVYGQDGGGWFILYVELLFTRLWCGRKDDKFLVLYLRRPIRTGYSNTFVFTLIVNGVERLSKTQEPNYKTALAVRIDDGGLAYIVYNNGEQYIWRLVFVALHYGSSSASYYSSSSAYGAISNKYGVFVVVRDYKHKVRKRLDGTEYTSWLHFPVIVWIRPKEKYAKDEDAIHILDADNSEMILITPLEPPKFGENPEDDEPSWEYPYMLFATTADKNAVIASYDDSIFDVTTIIKRYIASKGTDDEMTADDVGEWRGEAIKVGENGQAKMPDAAGSGANSYYMKPGLMHRPARNLIDALYFPADSQ